MRFIDSGPSIPDALLNARDEGRVVFFCGAGVSRQFAKLPDFFGLANAVICELGVPAASAARKVLVKAQEIGNELNVSGLISADRIFGLLEREFDVQDIRAAVARSLSTAISADLTAHKLLLRLATTPDSKTQLVTTNFDRLFTNCRPELTAYCPPRLPNLSRYDVLNGVVYLHGRANVDYTGPDGDGFVLSSSDFGYAYLSEGWATEFFREVVRRYVVVFVGYSADDPPVHYLLEGLRRVRDKHHSIYAFQADESQEAVARWQHKGVNAIPYTLADQHRSLWKTLELWADRSADPPAWRRGIVDLAMNGPAALLPHQRGQVAHIISTYEGAREFGERTPPAEWLCVFDPLCRYATPARSNWFESDSPIIDPFNAYGLDSDIVPEAVFPDDQLWERKIPSAAWDAFRASELDRQPLTEENLLALRGHNSAAIPGLPKRLEVLGRWIAAVADVSSTVWWAIKQNSLHPAIRNRIERLIERYPDKFCDDSAKAWRHLFESWDNPKDQLRREWYDVKREIDRKGWSVELVRRLSETMRPYLKASPALLSAAVPPQVGTDFRVSDLLRVEVECTVLPSEAKVPDEWVHVVIRELRKNLELAVQLGEEGGDPRRFHISPIIADDSPDISDFQRTRGLSGCVIQFASLFERLVALDASKAKREFFAWPVGEDTAFERLRIWAGGKFELVTPDEFLQVLVDLSDRAFWSSHHERDLLLALSNRWRSLSSDAIKYVEARLLRTYPRTPAILSVTMVN